MYHGALASRIVRVGLSVLDSGMTEHRAQERNRAVTRVLRIGAPSKHTRARFSDLAVGKTLASTKPSAKRCRAVCLALKPTARV